MARKGRARLRTLAHRVTQEYPELDATAAIAGGRVRVDMRVVSNPRSLVRDTASVTLWTGERELRGEGKLEFALEVFGVSAAARVALDLGASTGGFTRVLLRHGAARVYAVDAGYGQLLGSLRQDAAVVNLERTNLGDLSAALVPEEIDVVTVDLSYVALASALPQLDGRVSFSHGADLIALVKPMFELGLGTVPNDRPTLASACRRATGGAERAGWNVRGIIESPVTGRMGAIEFLLHATADPQKRASPRERLPPMIR